MHPQIKEFHAFKGNPLISMTVDQRPKTEKFHIRGMDLISHSYFQTVWKEGTISLKTAATDATDMVTFILCFNFAGSHCYKKKTNVYVFCWVHLHIKWCTIAETLFSRAFGHDHPKK